MSRPFHLRDPERQSARRLARVRERPERDRDDSQPSDHVQQAALWLQASFGNAATQHVFERHKSPEVAASPRIQRQLTDEERREIEERTGPLERGTAGPSRADVSERDRSALDEHLRTEIGSWLNATQLAVSDFVDDHQHETDFGPFALALMAAPLGPVGVGLTGAAALRVAIASASISVLSAVPNEDDELVAFRERMREAYENVALNRKNSSSAIVGNFLLTVSPTVATSRGRLTRALTRNCFAFAAGNAVDQTRTRRAARVRLDLEWLRSGPGAATRRRRQRARIRERRRLGQGTGAFPRRYPGNL